MVFLKGFRNLPIFGKNILSMVRRTHTISSLVRPVASVLQQQVSPFQNKKTVFTSMPVRTYASEEEPPYWDYTPEFGPAKWNKMFKADKRQSPIDILTKLARYDSTLTNYNIDNTPVLLNLKNFGLNVSITPKDEPSILINGGGLKGDVYRFREFHFHWGDGVNTCGCEHTLNGQRFAAELHIVHWNCSQYETEAEALSGEDGLAVLGVFLEAKDTYADNVYLNMLLDLYDNIKYKDTEYVSEKAFTPYSLLPNNTGEYFTYPGSLTTPPLTGNVTWTVFREPLKISMDQLQKFNDLVAVREDEENKTHNRDMFTRATDDIPQPPTITNNYRPVQGLYDRVVYASFDAQNQ